MYVELIFIVGLLGPAVMESTEPRCDEKYYEACMKNNSVFLQMQPLFLTSDPTELDEHCEKAVNGYKCAGIIMKDKPYCLPDLQIFKLSGVLHAAEIMYYLLCQAKESGKEPFLREAFLTNSSCISSQKKSVDNCFKTSDLEETPALNAIMYLNFTKEEQTEECCSFTEYLSCVLDVVGKNCGPKTTNFTRNYVRRIAGETMQLLCQNFTNYPEYTPQLCSGCICLHLFPLYVILSIVMIFVFLN